MKTDRTISVASKQKPTEARLLHGGIEEAYDERIGKRRVGKVSLAGVQKIEEEEEVGHP
jgi:hypothetical protein